jgi:hypothetical protein
MTPVKVGRSTHRSSSCEPIGSVVRSRFDVHAHRESISKRHERDPEPSSPAVPVGEWAAGPVRASANPEKAWATLSNAGHCIESNEFCVG